ncbi:MAG: hypothetical protein HC822_22780 [Oscillochloris sp.]|nr:hypothetical protein [Oscillochloris sp.]
MWDIRDNIFHETFIQDEVADTNDYTQRYNDNFSLAGGGFDFDDGNNITVNCTFVNAGSDNFNITNTACFNNDSDGRDRGAHRPPVLQSCNIGDVANDVIALSFSGHNPPVTVLNSTNFRPFKNTGGGPVLQTVTGTSTPDNTTIRLTLSTPAASGNTVSVAMLQGAAQNDRAIGGGQKDADSENALIVDGAAIVCSNTIGGAVVAGLHDDPCAGYLHESDDSSQAFCSVDAECGLHPTGLAVIRGQVEVETALAPSRTYEWWCSDNGGAYYQVGDTSTGWVSYTTSTRTPETPLAQLLALDGDTFVACGVRYSAPFSESSMLDTAAGRRLSLKRQLP